VADEEGKRSTNGGGDTIIGAHLLENFLALPFMLPPSFTMLLAALQFPSDNEHVAQGFLL